MGLALVDLLSYSHVDDRTIAPYSTENEHQKNPLIPIPELLIGSIYSFLLFLFPGLDRVYAVLGDSLPWRSLKVTSPKIKEVEKPTFYEDHIYVNPCFYMDCNT